LNNTSRIAYAVRPLIDFPHPDSYLVYPFVTLETNFIDGNMPRLSFVARYLDDQAAVLSVGYKETPNSISLEGQLWRQRFPHPDMTTSLQISDRLGARRLLVDTTLTLDESHQQYRIPANRFSLGYQVAFLEEQETFQGDPVPADTFPSTGRIHSLLLGYQRDVRVPPAAGAPLNVLAEPLAYGYALRLQVEIASKLLGSTEPDFQQVQWEASEFLRLGNQTWLQLRIFGGWSAGTVPFQSKLTLAGVQAVRGYPYRLRFLGDRLLGGTLGLRFPVLRDVRLEVPGRLFALRSVHVSPFIDAGWRWDIGEELTQKRLRSGVGLRLIARLGLASLFRFETAVDIAYPLDAQGRREGEGLQVWLRFQSTARAGVH
jgi:hemolysin activation/secretion protein